LTLSRTQERTRSYYETLYVRTPLWETRARIAEVYRSAARLRALGQPVEVDHIVPLNGIGVCGLHTVDNLRIVSKELNARKSNSYYPRDAGRTTPPLRLRGAFRGL